MMMARGVVPAVVMVVACVMAMMASVAVRVVRCRGATVMGSRFGLAWRKEQCRGERGGENEQFRESEHDALRRRVPGPPFPVRERRRGRRRRDAS
jgi:hypothetical protein